MAYTPKEGSGSLFKNDKGDNPARPDYRGDVMIEGVLYELSAWIKPLPSNLEKRFMSLSAKPKQVKTGIPAHPASSKAQQQRQTPRNDSGFDDMSDIPF